jgi:arylsulfatase A-like enzyme
MKNKITLALALCFAAAATLKAAEASKPNIIYLIDDELGYFEPGFMGGKTIQTPNLDKMAANGIVFRNLFAGGSVCAPTRCRLLTGKHAGHTSVRANGGGRLRHRWLWEMGLRRPRLYGCAGEARL